MNQLNFQKMKAWALEPKNRTLIFAFLAMIIIATMIQFGGSPTAPSPEAEDTSSIDTIIPDGYVLVPIDLQNAEILSSLIGEFAVVDLFHGPGGKKVGKRLKLLRAPLNKDQYAVLIPENEVGALMATPGPYWAVVQNPNQRSGASITQRKTKSRIEYYQGN